MSVFPEVPRLPEVDTPAMIEVDRLMMEDFQISLFQMMENAGRCLAILTREIALGGDPEGKRVLALAGGGGNGGGVLTASRRLATWGAEVIVLPAQERDRMSPVPRAQLKILDGLEGVSMGQPEDLTHPADVILDGLIGYSLLGSPGGRTAELIRWANAAPTPTIALDVPSGFDAATGEVRDPAVAAAATLTIALPKLGMQAPEARSTIGDLYCADISVPPELYTQLPSPIDLPPIFASGDVLRILP